MALEPKNALARAIVLAGVLIAAGLFWLGWRMEKRAPHAEASADPIASKPEAPDLPGGSAAPPDERADTGAAKLRYDALEEAWGAEADAASACWTESEEGEIPLPPVVHLFAVVRADGTVSDVSFRQPLPPGAQQLFLCVARIVKGLRVEPTGSVRKGEIQLMQPGVTYTALP